MVRNLNHLDQIPIVLDAAERAQRPILPRPVPPGERSADHAGGRPECDRLEDVDTASPSQRPN
jgi:hypothetical protein